ncbi:conjugal transfer protein TraB [Streptomyces sp. MZ04]|uniref:conjugal transfer protein TraB n=1 Tax=Streptomyces sp. MZ04 TaxID=2559236 RepID=UPI00107EB18D|nr:conjugal transfer protein TraB [Streptomyces sp. MZ04]TGB06548.1 conjugal transfer protein TraB [Streptomyces sp. MZ04]
MSDSTVIEPTSVQTGSEVAATAPDNAPTPRMGWREAIGGVLNFVTTGARVMALAVAAVLLKERMHLLKARMHRDAAFAHRVAEMCGQAGVDGRFVARYHEVGTYFVGVAECADGVTAAADTMEARARGVVDAHDREYRGIYESVHASPYQQPTPGFNRVP